MEGSVTATPPSNADAANASATNSRVIAYVANADSREISVLSLAEESGELTAIETVAAGGRAMPMAVSPDRTTLYAALRSEPYGVARFAIDPGSGRLTLVATTPLVDNMAYLALDQSGRYLFAASYSGSRISVNRVGAAGAVDPEPLTVMPTGKHAHAILTDPSNRFLFVPCLGDDRILQFRFDAATGEITPNDPPWVGTRPGSGPRHLVFHPDRRFAFGINELDGTVNIYRLEPGGALAPLATVSALPEGFSGKPWAADIHLTPDGRWLYTSERTSSTLAAFGVDAGNGTLTPLGHYSTETQPRGFAIAPDGRYLVASGEMSNGVSSYAIDERSGALRHVSRVRVGDDPNWVEIATLPG
jgi:6-phosphogluconolactonase